jgi:colicin import membrane protein
MKNLIVTALFLACIGVQAQTNSDAERLRIITERAKLEAAFALEDTACYKRFLVNNCLDEVKVRRRDALADLRRQEIVLNDEARKARAAEQILKIESKSAPEKLQEEADKRAQALKDFDERLARDKQKTADREALQAGEKAKADAAAGRIKGNQDKEAGRTAKQAAAAEELRKYNERQEQAKERQARNARDKASQAKAPANPLPAPQ